MFDYIVVLVVLVRVMAVMAIVIITIRGYHQNIVQFVVTVITIGQMSGKIRFRLRPQCARKVCRVLATG